MALFHLRTKILSRSKGDNVVRAIAYRRGIKLIDPKTQEIYDYSRKKNVVHSELCIPNDAPDWIKELTVIEKSDITKAAQLFSNSIELNEHRKDAVFTQSTLANLLGQYLTNHTEVAAAIMQIKNSPQVMAIGLGEDGREHYTTKSFFELENNLLRLAESLSATATHKLGKSLVKMAIKKFTLDHDQSEAMRYMLQGKDLVCIIGRAGTGKSYCLKAANWALQQQGFRVHGLAVAGVVAEDLERDAGIKSRTIESFIYALDHQLQLTAKDVVIMDEAGMTDNLSMDKIIRAVKQAGAKLILVGDPSQLPSVGPGAIFRAIVEQFGCVKLTTIRRQITAWQREATACFAVGNTIDALNYYEQHGCIELKDTKQAAMEQLIHDWSQSLGSSSLKDIGFS